MLAVTMMEYRFNFDDIEPVQLNEEEPQLCQILYDDEYKKVMAILLRLLQNKEYSERALYITEKGIELLASHYTIWCYRFDILVALDKDLEQELEWCEQIALENEKNYQIWNYRQLVIEKMVECGQNFNPYREFPITNAMLEEDVKNHHVWSYKKWLVERFQLQRDPKEAQFIDKCIDDDVRNNSAWAHRFFVKFSVPELVDDELIRQEIAYCQNAVELSPQNPSLWNYLTGIYRKFNLNMKELQTFCCKFADLNTTANKKELVKSSYALLTLAQIYASQGKGKDAAQAYQLLANRYDPIRKKYWNYKSTTVTS